jgi:hypothetical protein
MQRGNRGHGGVIARGTGLGRVDGGRGQRDAEGGEDLAGYGVGEVGKGIFVLITMV